MSRIARIPVTVDKGVEVQVAANEITVKGPLGTLKQRKAGNVDVSVANGEVSFAASDESREARAMSGTMRALVAGMVQGVSKGFERRLSVVHQMPVGVKCETPTQTEIVIKGSDKQKVGQVAAEVRGYKPPEPYKGKGVRYVGEAVIIKETKKK
jgi:large subunit ribosomal protein L6